jgi:hypothetical protein
MRGASSLQPKGMNYFVVPKAAVLPEMAKAGRPVIYRHLLGDEFDQVH